MASKNGSGILNGGAVQQIRYEVDTRLGDFYQTIGNAMEFLDDLVNRLTEETLREERSLSNRSAIADGAGNAIIDFGKPPVGSAWVIKSINVNTTGAVLAALGLDDPTVGVSSRYYSGITNTGVLFTGGLDLYVPAGRNLYALVNAGAGVSANVGLQYDRLTIMAEKAANSHPAQDE